MKKLALVAAAATAASAVPAMAQTATGPDYSALTGAVDFSSTTAAILSVGALVIGVALATMGVRKIVSLVRGA
ncbi:hypothetical protein VF14_35410 [Nostoc linckia z18]|uniref:hypothetical protein n=1 Tax=Nostoc linckia TaxID=92942 RepID=UPI000BFF9755|nr:hypothetical protein [Nostoc linckia]PHK28013.1 hypothetical protein VF14_35410 [Nostoc linckia z18]